MGGHSDIIGGVLAVKDEGAHGAPEAAEGALLAESSVRWRRG